MLYPPPPPQSGVTYVHPYDLNPLGKEIYPLSRELVTIVFSSSKNTPFPQDKCFKSTPFPGKVVIRMRPLMCSIGGGGGGREGRVLMTLHSGKHKEGVIML